jgi:DNA polymerase-1
VHIIHHMVDGERVTIKRIETPEDLREAHDFIKRHDPYTLCVDTESTGLDWWGNAFRVRLLQFGDAHTAYIYALRSRRDAHARAMIEHLFSLGVTLHNASYDILSMDACGLMAFDGRTEKYRDTRLLAHLIDPRAREDGGVGLGLKPLTARYIDPTAEDTQDGLKRVFTKENVTWSTIDVQHPTYELYAGLDVIYGARLHDTLIDMCQRSGFMHLVEFEHALHPVIVRMMRRGFKIDVDYSHKLIDILSRRFIEGREGASALGLANINSPKQVGEFFMGHGWVPREFTDSGNPKTDKAVLEALLNDPKTPDRVKQTIEHIVSAKRASKWQKAYAEGMLDARDIHDRVHAGIASLQARTSRMSISNPPLQQLPSRGDDAWVIRRQVIASEGRLIGSADYDQIEFRIAAALADISAMKRAIHEGRDLHDFTAELVKGPNFTKADRSLLKGVGFGKLFGGGATTLSRQTGSDIDAVKRAIREYESVYHELPAFARKLETEQRQRGGFILNHHGRYLPLDRGREYSAVNYAIQSIARDMLAQAIIDLAEAGIDDYLLLPVHDEVLFEAPQEDAKDVAHTVGEVMSRTFEGLPITASGEVYGKSWAHGYVYTDTSGVVRSKGTSNALTDWVPCT